MKKKIVALIVGVTMLVAVFGVVTSVKSQVIDPPVASASPTSIDPPVA